MSTRAGTVPLSDLQFIKIYFNRKRLRSTTANLKKMLAEAGGDAICNGSIFLRNQTPACHLKAEGKVYKAPNYRAWAISWNDPADFDVKTVPNGDRNYMECVHLIIGGKKISLVHCGADMRYRAPRTAIGTKNGRFAYYVSKDRRTPEQLRDLLAASGWDNAIMMDGGGSTCFMDSEGNGFAGDGRVIPFFLVWKLKSGDACEPEGEKPMVEINAYSKAKDGSKKLSGNFKVSEFACKDGSDAVLVAPRLVMVLQSIRDHFGAAVTINSGYRTPQYNAKVDGVTDSQHGYTTMDGRTVAPNERYLSAKGDIPGMVERSGETLPIFDMENVTDTPGDARYDNLDSARQGFCGRCFPAWLPSGQRRTSVPLNCPLWGR